MPITAFPTFFPARGCNGFKFGAATPMETVDAAVEWVPTEAMTRWGLRCTSCGWWFVAELALTVCCGCWVTPAASSRCCCCCCCCTTVVAFAAMPASGTPMADVNWPVDLEVVNTAAVPMGGEEEAGKGTDN